MTGILLFWKVDTNMGTDCRPDLNTNYVTTLLYVMFDHSLKEYDYSVKYKK